MIDLQKLLPLQFFWMRAHGGSCYRVWEQPVQRKGATLFTRETQALGAFPQIIILHHHCSAELIILNIVEGVKSKQR